MSLNPTSVFPGYILIVDDLPMNLRLLSCLLEGNGYQVKKALNGKTAIEIATVNPPYLILLDVIMPEMDGYAVCQQLKTLERLRDIPIIFISALDEILDKVKAFEMGAVDYITKPFQRKEVLARVKNQLTIRSLQAELQKKNQELTNQNLYLQIEITERKRAEAEINFLLETTKSVNNAADFNLALMVIIRSCCELINWDFGEAWIPNHDTNLLKNSQGWYAREPNLSEFGTQSLKLTFSSNTGLPGRIWSSKQPEWVEDFSSVSKVASKVGLKAGFGVPIIVEDRVLAVLIFFKKEVISMQPYLIELIQAVATQLGSLVQRKQAEEALIIAEERYHSIMESSGVAGEIQVTSVVSERLQEKFVFEERGEVSIKGKGKMTTYFLKGKIKIGCQ